MQPPMMNGRRRPSLDLHPSERTPTSGWTIKPERGPARKTTDIMLLLTPSESKNGEALHAGTMSASIKLGCKGGRVEGCYLAISQAHTSWRPKNETVTARCLLHCGKWGRLDKMPARPTQRHFPCEVALARVSPPPAVIVQACRVLAGERRASYSCGGRGTDVASLSMASGLPALALGRESAEERL